VAGDENDAGTGQDCVRLKRDGMGMELVIRHAFVEPISPVAPLALDGITAKQNDVGSILKE